MDIINLLLRLFQLVHPTPWYSLLTNIELLGLCLQSLAHLQSYPSPLLFHLSTFFFPLFSCNTHHIWYVIYLSLRNSSDLLSSFHLFVFNVLGTFSIIVSKQVQQIDIEYSFKILVDTLKYHWYFKNLFKCTWIMLNDFF